MFSIFSNWNFSKLNMFYYYPQLIHRISLAQILCMYMFIPAGHSQPDLHVATRFSQPGSPLGCRQVGVHLLLQSVYSLPFLQIGSGGLVIGGLLGSLRITVLGWHINLPFVQELYKFKSYRIHLVSFQQ